MKVKSAKHFDFIQYIDLKDNEWVEKQKLAGKCIAEVFTATEAELLSGKSLNLLDLEKLAENIISDHKCEPTFKGYKGFPGAICLSVNNELVHGIPHDYILQDGDVLKIDLGATLDGVIADAARTYIFGEPKSKEHQRLIDTCKKALDLAIESIAIDKRIGCIGYAIYNYVKNSGFGLITNYGGHGISKNKAHANPFISNKSRPNEGVRITSGMSFAIEPMLVIGPPQTTVEKDGWTVNTPGIAAHFEDTVMVTDTNIIVVTR